MGLGFAPVSSLPALIAGLALLTVLLAGARPRRAFGLGYLAGLGLFGVAVTWLQGLGWWIAALLVVWMALYVAGYALALRFALALPGWPAWAACCWSLSEFVASRWPFGGFGWIRLGFAVVDTPWAGLLRVVGVTGAGVVVALVAQCLAAAALWALAGRCRAAACAAIAAALISAAGAGAGAWALHAKESGAGSIVVGIVQGNVDGGNRLEPFGRARSVTHNHLSATVDLRAQAAAGLIPAPDVVLWPENSTDIDPSHDRETAEVIQTASRMVGVPILVGSVLDGPGPEERQTGGLWWEPNGQITQRYMKRNLVPFGEYIPYRSVLLPRLPILELTGAQGVPGTSTGIFIAPRHDGDPGRLGDVICFELAYDATVFDTARAAQALVVQSNNASYGGTPQVEQQWAMTRARAIETDRDIAVATTNSLSGIVRADGSVEARSREFESYTTASPLLLRSRTSTAVRVAPTLGWVVAALGIAAPLAGAAVERRRRRSQAAVPGEVVGSNATDSSTAATPPKD